MEPDNVHDKYAVNVLKNAVVGMCLEKYSVIAIFVLNSGGTMGATVTGARENRRRGNGLTVPCKYKLKGSKSFLPKAEYIIRDIV